MSFDAVSVEGVGKSFGRQRALGGVSLRLERGKLTALIGPNGAGKSTLVGILSTLVRPTTGKVRYLRDGREGRDGGRGQGEPTPAEVRGAIGVLAHDSLLYSELDAVENLLFFGSLYGLNDASRRVAALLDEVGLETSARTRPCRTYSRGMLQRLALARALLPRPAMLLLDEPFTGLDRGGVAALGKTLETARSDGKIVLVVSHDFEAVGGLVDHLVILRGGKVTLDERPASPYSAAELRDRYVAHMG